MSQPQSQYKSQTPTSPALLPSIAHFFESFYAASDTGTAAGHEAYVRYFTDDAVLVMASTRGVGSSEILEIRKSMWRKVLSRRHAPIKIFPFGDDPTQVMLFGTVDYVLKEEERKVTVEWAARAELVESKEDGKEGWKMAFYQVYLDTAAMSK